MARSWVNLFWVFLPLIAQAQTELALTLIQEAYKAYQSGQQRAAQTLAEQALDFSTDLGDAYILLALTRNISVQERKELAEKALAQGRFAVVPSHHAVRAFVQQLLRQDAFEQAQQFLSLREETGFHADLTAMRIHCLLALGREEAAISFLRQARDRFPDRTELVPYLIRYPNLFPEWEARLRLQLTQAGWWKDNGHLIMQLMPTEPALRATVIRALRRSLPNDADLTGWELSLRLLSWEEALTRWEQAGLPRNLELTQSLGRLVPPAQRQRWENLVSQQSGTFVVFARPLSVFRETRVYERGQLTTVGQDLDGDGSPELSWIFNSGNLQRWQAKLYIPRGQGEGSWEVVWKQYPVLAQVTWNRPLGGGSQRRVFEFIPDGVRLIDTNTQSQASFPGTSFQPLVPPPLESVLPQAVRLSDYGSDGRLRRRMSLENGRVYLIEEDRAGNGRRDTVVLLRGGRVERVWRDVEGRGVWSIFQRYSDGLPMLTQQSDSYQQTSFLWRGLEEGLFLIGENYGSTAWPVWQQGLARLSLDSWNQNQLPQSLPKYPVAPFDSLGEWK